MLRVAIAISKECRAVTGEVACSKTLSYNKITQFKSAIIKYSFVQNTGRKFTAYTTDFSQTTLAHRGAV